LRARPAADVVDEVRDPVALHDGGRVLQPQRLGQDVGGEEGAAGAENHRYQVDDHLVDQPELERLAADLPGRDVDVSVARERVGFANSSAALRCVELARFRARVMVEGGCLLWSFVYLVVRNLFVLVCLLGRPRGSKEMEILVLRHELSILRRQPSRPTLTRADRALLAALSRSLPRTAWAGFSFKPETLLRWHRQLIARRWTYSHRPPGRPPLECSLRELILRLARENPHWGYKRIVGEVKGLGISVSATSVRKVLLEAGLQPAPQRTHSSWRAFLRAQAASMLACDFLTVETIFLQRIYVLFFISLATRRIEYVQAKTRIQSEKLRFHVSSTLTRV